MQQRTKDLLIRAISNCGVTAVWITSSGTTKYIPLSKEMLASNRKAAFTTMALFRNAFPQHRTFTGKFFFLGGCTDLRAQSDGSHAGDLSGIAAKEVIAATRPMWSLSAIRWGLKANGGLASAMSLGPESVSSFRIGSPRGP